MRIWLTRLFLAVVPALFCTIAFLSAPANAGQASSFSKSVTQEPLLLAVNNDHDSNYSNYSNYSNNNSNSSSKYNNDNNGGRDDRNNNSGKDDYGRDEHSKDNHGKKVYVCHVLPHGKFMTQYLPKETAEMLAAKHSDEWILRKCEDVVSHSGEQHKHY
jgi:hypothetical protein